MFVLISTHAKERLTCPVKPAAVGEIMATPSGEQASHLMSFLASIPHSKTASTKGLLMILWSTGAPVAVLGFIVSVDRAVLNQELIYDYRSSARVRSGGVVLGSFPSMLRTFPSRSKIFPAMVPVTRNCRCINQSAQRCPTVKTSQVPNNHLSTKSLVLPFSCWGITMLSSLALLVKRWRVRHTFWDTVSQVPKRRSMLGSTLYKNLILFLCRSVPYSRTAKAMTVVLHDTPSEVTLNVLAAYLAGGATSARSSTTKALRLSAAIVAMKYSPL